MLAQSCSVSCLFVDATGLRTAHAHDPATPRHNRKPRIYSAFLLEHRLHNSFQARLARRCPFYYGWVILGVAAVSSYSTRPLMASAVLAVFVVPMTAEYGWTRGEISGA